MSLVDTVGSLAIASRGHQMTGVSVDISTSFVRPAGTSGSRMTVHGTVVGFGKTLAFTRVDIKDESGKLVAFGNHTKFIGKIEVDKTFSADGETVVEGEDEA